MHFTFPRSHFSLCSVPASPVVCLLAPVCMPICPSSVFLFFFFSFFEHNKRVMLNQPSFVTLWSNLLVRKLLSLRGRVRWASVHILCIDVHASLQWWFLSFTRTHKTLTFLLHWYILSPPPLPLPLAPKMSQPHKSINILIEHCKLRNFSAMGLERYWYSQSRGIRVSVLQDWPNCEFLQ